MNTRMEKVAEDVALKALRSAGTASDPSLDPEALREAFRARWPTQDSQRPMNDAIAAAAQAASSFSGQDAGSWETTISRAWQPAVEEVVEKYFKDAQHSFEKGEPLEGVEALTDAVRATLGHIAATRNWPHGSHEDLYSIAAALSSGNDWPTTMEEFDRALENASKKGEEMRTAFAASMGRPRMLKFGAYAENPEGPREDGILFATTAIELAKSIAGQAAA